MDTDRWQTIESIFQATIDVPAGSQRDAALADLCAGNPALLAEVRALLDEDVRLQQADAAADPHLGLRLGAHRIVRLVARGGMAAVYEGRRDDDAFEQRVAIKIMDIRLDDAALVAQFRAERQILAALEHPAISRLLDGGVTAIGEPYLVMEFVDGEPIDRYCDGRQLDLPARLRLFGTVCDGVAFAHRNLVLHRDLKPSNILVTVDGHPKIVDFGTATLLQPDRDATLSRAPLTPAYASPEQLTGQAVGTATDQYSLGLVLYELVTGGRAFGDRTSFMASVERAMTGVPPTAPPLAVTPEAAATRRVSPARLRRQVAGDLGTIVLKALAPDPYQRYSSIQHLADDVMRWLQGAPIEGRPPSLLYQTSRFVRRHWVATTIAATLAVALFGATAMSVLQAREARAQESRARSESARSQQLNAFLTEMLASANPTGNATTAARSQSLTVREVLDTASRNVAATLGRSPDIEAEMHHTLGRTYLGIGALDQAEAEFDKALTLYRGLGHRAGIASTLAQHGRSRVLRGQMQAAAPFLREAVALEQARGGQADPVVLSYAMNNLALTITTERPADPEAIELLRASVRIADAHGMASASVVEMRQALGNQLMIGGFLSESEAALRAALAQADRVAPDHPTRLYVLRSLSELLRTRGAHDEAARVGQLAVEGAARAWPPEYSFQPAFLVTWGRADLDRAERVLLDAGTRYRAIRPAGHPDFATLQLALGTVYRRQGTLGKAESTLRAALAVLQPFPNIRHTRAHVLGELGLTLRALGREAEGGPMLADSHATYRDLLGDTHPFTVTARARLDGATE
jgi:serine/threonine protein kinase